MSTYVLMIHDAHLPVSELIFPFMEAYREMLIWEGTRLVYWVQISEFHNTIKFSSSQSMETIARVAKALTCNTPHTIVRETGEFLVND